jgi:hypothetical protein
MMAHVSNPNATEISDLGNVIARYSTRLHRVAGDEHHVASPLGAWIILALCGSLSTGATRSALAEALGMDIDEASLVVARLLQRPHPFVCSAAAVWNRSWAESPVFNEWKASLQSAIETGDIPDQHGLDSWADDHTLGLIKKFPINIAPETLFVIASALATKVSWVQPFELVRASRLGPNSEWSSEVNRVLASQYRHGHSQYIADTEEAGRVAVHTALAIGGVSVTSVIADQDVPYGSVLSAAHEIAKAEASGQAVKSCSLFDLPVGEHALWTITEEQVETTGQDGREEWCRAVLPAWEANSVIGLRDPDLGFSSAAQSIAEALKLGAFVWEATQSAMARYTRTGFEAAAITGMAIATSARRTRPGIRRTAELRFGHPFASVAVSVGEKERGGQRSPWHGLPVFSAWISEPIEGVE